MKSLNPIFIVNPKKIDFFNDFSIVLHLNPIRSMQQYSTEAHDITTLASLPSRYWETLSTEDRTEFFILRDSFRSASTPASRERGPYTILDELRHVISFVNRKPENRESRSIVSGLYYGGTFICVNTRQLKILIGRCKSSINNGFQQLGYVSDKSKVKQTILSVLPSLVNDLALLRQWTVRTSDSAPYGLKDSREKTIKTQPAKKNEPIPMPILKKRVSPLQGSVEGGVVLPSVGEIETQNYFGNQNLISRPLLAPPENVFVNFDGIDEHSFDFRNVAQEFHGFSASHAKLDEDPVFF